MKRRRIIIIDEWDEAIEPFLPTLPRPNWPGLPIVPITPFNPVDDWLKGGCPACRDSGLCMCYRPERDRTII